MFIVLCSRTGTLDVDMDMVVDVLLDDKNNYILIIIRVSLDESLCSDHYLMLLYQVPHY